METQSVLTGTWHLKSLTAPRHLPTPEYLSLLTIQPLGKEVFPLEGPA